MSVESGVGVACGCLPGCKPLMNRMFPRVFATAAQPSYSKPSASDRMTQLQAGSSPQQSGTIEQQSYQLRSLPKSYSGSIFSARHQHTSVGRPMPSQHSLSQQSWGAHNRCSSTESKRGLAEIDEISDTSTEYIIRHPSKHWR